MSLTEDRKSPRLPEAVLKTFPGRQPDNIQVQSGAQTSCYAKDLLTKIIAEGGMIQFIGTFEQDGRVALKRVNFPSDNLAELTHEGRLNYVQVPPQEGVHVAYDELALMASMWDLLDISSAKIPDKMASSGVMDILPLELSVDSLGGEVKVEAYAEINRSRSVRNPDMVLHISFLPKETSPESEKEDKE